MEPEERQDEEAAKFSRVLAAQIAEADAAQVSPQPSCLLCMKRLLHEMPAVHGITTACQQCYSMSEAPRRWRRQALTQGAPGIQAAQDCCPGCQA